MSLSVYFVSETKITPPPTLTGNQIMAERNMSLLLNVDRDQTFFF